MHSVRTIAVCAGGTLGAGAARAPADVQSTKAANKSSRLGFRGKACEGMVAGCLSYDMYN